MMQDDDDDADDNDDPMILNIRAKIHTSERTIVPWTVIFIFDIWKVSQSQWIYEMDLWDAGASRKFDLDGKRDWD